MATFEINLNKINEDIAALNRYIKNYKQVISTVNTTLKNVDSFWADYNTEPFIKTISSDEKTFLNHINAVSSYVDVIEKFCSDIKQCIFKYTGNSRVIKLKYNSSNMNLLIQDLEKANLFLNKALSTLESINMPLTFKYRVVLNYYERDLKNYIKTVGLTKYTLENINRIMNNIFASAKTKNARIEFKTVDSKKLGYRWRTYSSSLKKLEEKSGEEHNLSSIGINEDVQYVSSQDINTSAELGKNNVIIELLDVDDVNEINVTYSGDIENLNVNSSGNKIDDINITYVGDIDNINSGTVNNTEVNNINVTYNGDIEDLNANSQSNKIDDINITYTKDMDNINGNNSSNIDLGNIDITNNNDVEKIGNNMHDYNINQSNITYDSDEKSINTNDSNLNINANSSVNYDIKSHSTLDNLDTNLNFNNVKINPISNEKNLNNVSSGNSLNNISSNIEVEKRSLDDIESL